MCVCVCVCVCVRACARVGVCARVSDYLCTPLLYVDLVTPISDAQSPQLQAYIDTTIHADIIVLLTTPSMIL